MQPAEHLACGVGSPGWNYRKPRPRHWRTIASTWSFISEISGDTTIPTLAGAAPGSGSKNDLPPPVGISTEGVAATDHVFDDGLLLRTETGKTEHPLQGLVNRI